MAERADAARNRAAVLDAASRLFDDADDPRHVSMEEIARVAGVGKGTLFRRFGDRVALLHAVYESRLTDLRAAVDSGPPATDPPVRRIAALLEAVVLFKLSNRRLVLAVESVSAGAVNLYHAPQYTELHSQIVELLREAGWTGDAGWTAHALLALTRIDLINHLVIDSGMSADSILAELRAHVDRLLGG